MLCYMEYEPVYFAVKSTCDQRLQADSICDVVLELSMKVSCLFTHKPFLGHLALLSQKGLFYFI